ncbi:hypothetical protein ESA94_06710 [Lacibacter luteus]|uniref:Uncharacterized protein n=1 Tax=Lacibacter luteus TaxID=2508719 RepID=A0A4Q1CNL3_9BACT|nr:hypothetical protein [Lacibacter luteus]RXK62683.1 hypothetical protein ESA94_06710 [Lacibacter luteus]
MKMFFKIFVVFVFIGCNSKPKSRFEFLKGVSTTVNKMCPMQVDSILKLENTVALPPATFRYNYILKYDTVKYDIHEFEKSLRITTLNMVRTNPESKMFRDINTTVEFNYSDTLGNYLFRIVLKPEEYK